MSERNSFYIKGGIHTLSIYPRKEINDKNYVIINCTDDDTITMDMDGEWIEEHSSACYVISDKEELQKIINELEKLKNTLK